MKEFGPDDGDEEEREAVLARGCPPQIQNEMTEDMIAATRSTSKYHAVDNPDAVEKSGFKQEEAPQQSMEKRTRDSQKKILSKRGTWKMRVSGGKGKKKNKVVQGQKKDPPIIRIGGRAGAKKRKKERKKKGLP